MFWSICKPQDLIRRQKTGSAFTLIELLVVVAIIAVLISIVLPALAGSRVAARQTICLTNHRQLVVAWSSYTSDYGTFPYGSDVNSYQAHEEFGWGGVNWYPTSGVVPGLNLAADRPLNAYVGADQRIESRVTTFRCPLDTGDTYWSSGGDALASVAVGSVSGESNTFYGYSGTSYGANLWMYCRPGAIGGWGIGSNAGINYRSNLGPQHVYVSPSRFVVLYDQGPANWIVSTIAQRNTYNLGGKWWHGKEKGALGFLDGSARVEKSGRLVSNGYSMHMLDVRNANTGYLWPNHAP